MRSFTKGQFALGGFGFLIIWIVIMSQNVVGPNSGFAVLFNPSIYTDSRPALWFVSSIFIFLSIFCFYKALRDERD